MCFLTQLYLLRSAVRFCSQTALHIRWRGEYFLLCEVSKQKWQVCFHCVIFNLLLSFRVIALIWRSSHKLLMLTKNSFCFSLEYYVLILSQFGFYYCWFLFWINRCSSYWENTYPSRYINSYACRKYHWATIRSFTRSLHVPKLSSGHCVSRGRNEWCDNLDFVHNSTTSRLLAWMLPNSILY
jgi:hypothetical protein